MARGPRKGSSEAAPRKTRAKAEAAPAVDPAVSAVEETAPAAAVEAAPAPAPATERRGRGRPPKKRPNGPAPEKIAEYLAELTSLKTSSARISQRIAALLARFENEGGDRKELKAMLVLSKLDKREAEAAVLRHITYAQALGFVQEEEDGQFNFASLFGSEGATEGATDQPALAVRPGRDPAGEHKLALAQSYSDGWNTGRHGGGKSNNPHAPGSELHVRWEEGLTDGLADKIGTKPKTADRAALSLVTPSEGVAENPAMGLPH